MLVRRNYRPLFREFDWVAKELNRSIRHNNVATSGFESNVTDDEIVISAELPGFDSDNLNITLENNVLTIAGERKIEDNGEDINWVRRERHYGSFTRSFKLPYAIEADGVAAAYANGFLTLTLPRSEAEKPRQIEVKAA